MVELPTSLLNFGISLIFGLALSWMVTVVLIIVIGGHELMNNLKLFFFNRFRGGGWGIVRMIGSDLKEKSYIKKIDSLMNINKGVYAGTADVTFFRGTVPIRQHVKGLVNAIDLLQRKTRSILINFGETPIACPNCKETVSPPEVIVSVDIPTPQISDSSDLISHAIAQAQTVNPAGFLDPKVIQWAAIGAIGVIFGLALMMLFTNPSFTQFLAAASSAR